MMKKVMLIFMAMLLSVVMFTSCEKKDTKTFDEPYTDVYSDDGTIEKKVYYNDDGSINSEIKYEYDEHGNIVTETKYLSDGTFDFKSTYEYKQYGNEIKEIKRVVYKSENEIEFSQGDYEYEKYSSNGGEHYRLVSFVRYGKDGNQIDKTVYSYAEDQSLKTISTYDPKGNLLSKNEFSNE